MKSLALPTTVGAFCVFLMVLPYIVSYLIVAGLAYVLVTIILVGFGSFAAGHGRILAAWLRARLSGRQVSLAHIAREI